jgi:hypothetical protein
MFYHSDKCCEFESQSGEVYSTLTTTQIPEVISARGGGWVVSVRVRVYVCVCVCVDILIYFATSNLIYSINTHTKTRQLLHLIKVNCGLGLVIFI